MPAGSEYFPASPARNLAHLAGRLDLLLPKSVSAAHRRVLSTLPPKQQLRALGVCARILGILRNRDISVIYSNHAAVRSFGALLAADAARLPFALVLLGSEFASPHLKPYLPLARHLIEAADVVIAISQHTARLAARCGTARIPDVVYLGVQHARFERTERDAAVRGQFGLRDAVPLILYAGAMVERKGPQVLLAAASQLSASGAPDFDVAFVGPDLGMGATLRSAVERSALPHVHLLGTVSEDTLPDLYGTADILVFPTITEDEGFGLVALEAAAAGCAIVGSRIGAIPEVSSEGENALLFSPGDSTALAAALAKLLNDPDLLRRLQVASPTVAGRFRWDRCARETATLLDRARSASRA